MRFIFCQLLLALSTIASATSYYVSPTGRDSNNGSSSSPWKTLAYACTKAKTSGDIIYINAGTFYETDQSNLAVGVSIVGAGMTNCIIESSYSDSDSPLIKLETTNGWLGTYGNQSISGIKLDGDMTTYAAIFVNFRSNVKIHDCTFVDFTTEGVMFSGQAEYTYTGTNPYDIGTFPNYWCSGNEFYNNVVTNCSEYSDQGYGNLELGTQYGMKIYGNRITQTGRDPGSNGYGIKFAGRGFNRGTKCYNNTITIAPQEADKYNFSIEIWNDLDECEYYNNTIQGCLDITSSWKRNGTYGVWIHDNTLGFISQQDHDEIGIDVEAYQNGLIISNNIIKNVSEAIYFAFIWPIGDHTKNNYQNDIHIYNNLIYGIGITEGGWSYGGIYGITTGSSRIEDTWSNVYIYNNAIVASGNHQSETYATVGIRICDFGVNSDNIQIKNNIIKGFTGGTIYSAPILGTGSSNITNLKITNNLFYGNGNSNAVKWSNSFSPGTGYVNSNPTPSDPLFVSDSDFQLKSGSPAIGKGIDVGLITDYKGNKWNTPPCIGAYEYNPPVPAPVLPVYQNSVIENATPSLLEMTYNLSLSSVIPSTSAFSVMVNSVNRTVNKVTVSGTKVLLTLTSPVVNGDKVTVLYTKPASNPIQTQAGGHAATISEMSVTNKVAPVIVVVAPVTVAVAPLLVGSTIEDATPDLLELRYNSPLASVIPAVSSFSVEVNSLAMSVKSIAVSGTSVFLTLEYEVLYGDIITIVYTKPSASALQSAAGIQIASMPHQTVINKVISVGPIYLSSSIEKNTPKILEINFDEIVDNSIPSTSSFIVKVNENLVSILSVSITGNSVLLALEVPVVYGDNVTVSYIKPSSNQLRKATGAEAVSFSSPQPVINNIAKLADIPIKKGNIMIYPSPARDFINISILETSLEPQILKIYDFSGKLFIENQLNPGTNSKVLINLNSGIYIAQIVSGSIIKYVQKLIVL
jgi:uncharacterized repeat protein (TIGR02059 family)